MTKYLVDEDMPRRTAAELQRIGFDVIDVRDVGLRSHPDEDIIAFAQAHERAIITRDKGFASEPMLRTLPSFGVVLSRVSDEVLREPIIELALETVETLRDQPLNGMVVIATTKRTRLRRVR